MKKLDIDKTVNNVAALSLGAFDDSDWTREDVIIGIKQAIREVLPEILNYIDNCPNPPKLWIHDKDLILKNLGI